MHASQPATSQVVTSGSSNGGGSSGNVSPLSSTDSIPRYPRAVSMLSPTDDIESDRTGAVGWGALTAAPTTAPRSPPIHSPGSASSSRLPRMPADLASTSLDHDDDHPPITFTPLGTEAIGSRWSGDSTESTTLGRSLREQASNDSLEQEASTWTSGAFRSEEGGETEAYPWHVQGDRLSNLSSDSLEYQAHEPAQEHTVEAAETAQPSNLSYFAPQSPDQPFLAATLESSVFTSGLGRSRRTRPGRLQSKASQTLRSISDFASGGWARRRRGGSVSGSESE